MIRRTARLRREYLYRKSLEGKEKAQYDKKRVLKKALDGAFFVSCAQEPSRCFVWMWPWPCSALQLKDKQNPKGDLFYTFFYKACIQVQSFKLYFKVFVYCSNSDKAYVLEI
jgi:hypothetical protein